MNLRRFCNVGYLFGLMVCGLILVTSCEKLPGEGGTASISGKVFVQEYLTVELEGDAYYVPEERVYLIYGDEETVFDEDTRTSYDGTFSFEFLRQGKYQVFVYTECAPNDDTCPSGVSPIIREVEISENGQDVVLDDFLVDDY